MPWFNICLNIVSVGIMVRYGLPKIIPFFGREDDPVVGFVGLALFATSVAIRINTILVGAP